MSKLTFLSTARKETAREKMLKEEKKILESVAEKKGKLFFILYYDAHEPCLIMYIYLMCVNTYTLHRSGGIVPL